MKQHTILKASSLALALALGFAAMPSMAADDDSYSDSYSTPRDSTMDSDTQMQAPPSEATPPPPSVIDESGMDTQRGARGPIRSDEMSSSRNQNDRMYGNNSSASPAERGYQGFLLWQRQNSNTP